MKDCYYRTDEGYMQDNVTMVCGTWDAAEHGPRPWMKEIREGMGLTRKQMAKKCQCSADMLRMLEDDGEITVPGIVSRIAAGYGLTLDQYNDLVHPGRRATELPPPSPPPKWDPYHSW